MRNTLLSVLALVMCLLGRAAHADPYLYSVIINDPNGSLSASFIEPSIITENGNVDLADVVSASWTYNGVSGDQFRYIFVSPVFDLTQPIPESIIIFLLSPIIEYPTIAFNEDITSVGTYEEAYFGDGSLTISDLSATTPEPATSILLGTGILGIICLAQLRRLGDSL